MFHYFQIQANFFIMTNIKIDESWKIELIDDYLKQLELEEKYIDITENDWEKWIQPD